MVMFAGVRSGATERSGKVIERGQEAQGGAAGGSFAVIWVELMTAHAVRGRMEEAFWR